MSNAKDALKDLTQVSVEPGQETPLLDAMAAQAAGPLVPESEPIGTDVPLPATPDTFSLAAATVARTDPGDPTTETSVNVDYEFADYDPTAIEPYLAKHGAVPDAAMAYHWCNRDERIFPRRQSKGWEPVTVKGRRILKGVDQILCHRPLRMNEAERARFTKLNRDRQSGPMAAYDNKVRPMTEGGQFSTFEGSRSSRDGLD